ncbi:MAG TPA: hypothetical protein VF753_11810, partial [Terriglobales bacterium]
TATMRTITPGVTESNVTAVEGVQAGEVVATNGFDKLQDGIKVAVRNGQGQGSGSGSGAGGGQQSSSGANGGGGQ